MRISVFGLAAIVSPPPPIIDNVVVNYNHYFCEKMESGTVRIVEVKALDGLTFQVQIVKDNGKIKYFVENPHKNVWINGN